MENAETWNNIWERIKTTTKIKSRKLREDDDFVDLHWTADEILDQDISDTLEEAAREIDEPPQPSRKYRAGVALEDYSEKVDFSRKTPRFMFGMGAGTMLGLGIAATSNLPFGPMYGAVGGGVLSIPDYFVSKGMRKTGERLKGEEVRMQAVGEEKQRPSSISYRLSDRENDVYGFKAFRDEGIEWTETVETEELDNFLKDLGREAETNWQVKRKEDHPLQVVGLESTYKEPRDHTYDRRNKIAEEIAEEDNVSVREVLDVDGDGTNPVPTESDYGESEQEYRFVIVDTNPEHSYDMESDFMDYSDILQLSEETDNYESEVERELVKES